MDEDFSLDILYVDQEIYEELFHLILTDSSSQLDIRLNQLSNPEQYLRIFNEHDQQLSLLMIAASNGYNDVVRVLLTHDNTPDHVELRGTVVVSDQLILNGVTAHYCACYHGHFTVAKTLIELGHANVNETSDDEQSYPLLLHATMMNRRDIIDFLLDNNYADINETKTFDQYQLTALVAAASAGQTSFVEYLIGKGADVNYSGQNLNPINSTPLTAAVMRGHLDTVRVLLHAGADTNILKQNEDHLVSVAIRRQFFSMIDFLLEQSFTTIEQVELTACSCIGVHHDIESLQQFLQCLKLTLRWRERLVLSKVCIEPIVAYDYQQECQTVDELDSIKDNPQRIFIETLLIRERIALSRNDISIVKPLHSYGDSLVSRGEFEKCLDVWIHMFYLYQRMNVKPMLLQLVWLFCRMMTENVTIPVAWLLKVGRLVFESSLFSLESGSLQFILCLIVIATKILEQADLSQSDRISIYSWVKDVCRLRPTNQDGITLLHICVQAGTYYRIDFRPNEIRRHLKFPNESALRLLLSCGSRWLDLDAAEHNYENTPLHYACQSHSNREILELLLEAGCHTDCANINGETPLDLIADLELRSFYSSKVFPSKLKCLCARFIVKERSKINWLSAMSSTLNKFVILHGYNSKEVDSLIDFGLFD